MKHTDVFKTSLTNEELNALSETLEFLRYELETAILEEYEKKINRMYSLLLSVYDKVEVNV
jgi:hypothetical protein